MGSAETGNWGHGDFITECSPVLAAFSAFWSEPIYLRRPERAAKSTKGGGSFVQDAVANPPLIFIGCRVAHPLFHV